MFCEGCGSPVNDAGSFCSSCGRPRGASPAAPITQSVGGAAAPQATATLTPVDQFPTPQSAGSGFSVAGIILGALAFLFFPIVFGPAGLILGAIAKSKGEEKAVVAMTVAACGTMIGIIIGAIVGATIF
jgi:hypothetical protein